MTLEKDEFGNDRDELRAIQAVFEKSVTSNTIEDVRPFVHPDFSFVSFTDKSFNNFDSFKEQWIVTRREMVGSGSFLTQLNPEPTSFIDNVAIAHGNADNTLIDTKGQRYNFTSHWTVVFKRLDGEWKVFRAHNSLDPFNNPMLISGVKRSVIKYGILAFIGGVVLCSMFSYLIPG